MRKKEFLNILTELCASRHSWQVWEDVITVIALSIANVLEHNNKKRMKREAEYQQCIKRLGGEREIKKAAKLMDIIVNALEENPEQDFLGKLYMELKLGNHWKGQFFTPYSISYTMAELSMNDIHKKIDKKGFISIHDPCCGAGVLFIACANLLRKKGINFQQKSLFIGQDIDRIAAMMCYIQISLLGCAGYIVVGNSLTNPVEGVLSPIEKEGLEIWYTPMYFNTVWQLRKIMQETKCLFSK